MAQSLLILGVTLVVQLPPSLGFDCFLHWVVLRVVLSALQVYSVDCNPAQSALLELKQVAIRELDYEDVWALFGEGKVSGSRVAEKGVWKWGGRG